MGHLIFTVISLIAGIVDTDGSEECILDRNEFNKYPFVVMIKLDSQMAAHGSLVTPRHVLSPLNPLRKVPSWPTLEFKVHVFDGGGAVKCSITRTLKYQQPLVVVGRPNMACWTMKRAFPVTANRPFLFKSLDDMSPYSISEHLESTKDEDVCELPVLVSEDSNVVELNVTSVRFVHRDTPDHEDLSDLAYCLDRVCQESSLYAVNSTRQLTESWYEGAVMLCHDHPLGILDKVFSYKNLTIMRFEYIDFAPSFLDWAKEEWKRIPLSRERIPLPYLASPQGKQSPQEETVTGSAGFQNGNHTLPASQIPDDTTSHSGARYQENKHWLRPDRPTLWLSPIHDDQNGSIRTIPAISIIISKEFLFTKYKLL